MTQEDLKAQLLYSARVLSDLHKIWTPHEGQLEPGKSLFYDGKQFIFLECGRKYGKTDFVIYSLYRAAMTTPNASCYFIAPYFKQAKELIWANNRLQNFLHRPMREKYLKGKPNNTEMRINFKNGSFIKLDGSDSYAAYDGVNPHFVAYDEFKDHHPLFHERMEPNLATYRAPLLVIGTPPENDSNHYIKIADSIKNDEDGAWFNYPSHSNPHISKEWLDKTKNRLIARGEYDVWMREYMAQRVKGGRNAVFPMFDENKHVIKYDDAISEVKRRYRDYEFVFSCDPASSSTFAVLFSAVHKYTREVTHLDEIYEQSTMETTSRKIWRRIEEIVKNIHPVMEEWVKVYDEAAAWFANEIQDITHGDVFLEPTRKSSNKKEDGISLIKDQMLHGFFKITDRCKHTRFEVANYIKDQNGKVPKENDHNIDNMRYTNAAVYYTQIPQQKPEEVKSERRGYTIEEDFEIEREKIDWIKKSLGELYD